MFVYVSEHIFVFNLIVCCFHLQECVFVFLYTFIFFMLDTEYKGEGKRKSKRWQRRRYSDSLRHK